MPKERSYDPLGEAGRLMPRPPENVKDPVTQAPVEDFRLTDEMRGFSAMFKRILGLAGQIQKGVFSAASEFQKRRNIFADVVGSLTTLSEMAPRNKLMGINGSMSQDLGTATEEYNQSATQRSQEEPFNLRSLMTTLGQRGELTETVSKVMK